MKISKEGYERLTAILGRYEPLIANLRETTKIAHVVDTPEGKLMEAAANAIADLQSTLAFRTGYLFGLAAKHGEDLDDYP